MSKGKIEFHRDDGKERFGFRVSNSGVIEEYGSGLKRGELLDVARRYSTGNYSPVYSRIPFGLQYELKRALRK